MSAPNVGYVAVKYFGATLGVLIGGAAGGLASSTAVTITNARRAAAREGSARLLAAGVAVASAVMFIRVAQSLLWSMREYSPCWRAAVRRCGYRRNQCSDHRVLALPRADRKFKNLDFVIRSPSGPSSVSPYFLGS